MDKFPFRMDEPSIAKEFGLEGDAGAYFKELVSDLPEGFPFIVQDGPYLEINFEEGTWPWSEMREHAEKYRDVLMGGNIWSCIPPFLKGISSREASSWRGRGLGFRSRTFPSLKRAGVSHIGPSRERPVIQRSCSFPSEPE